MHSDLFLFFSHSVFLPSKYMYPLNVMNLIYKCSEVCKLENYSNFTSRYYKVTFYNKTSEILTKRQFKYSRLKFKNKR